VGIECRPKARVPGPSTRPGRSYGRAVDRTDHIESRVRSRHLVAKPEVIASGTTMTVRSGESLLFPTRQLDVVEPEGRRATLAADDAVASAVGLAWSLQLGPVEGGLQPCCSGFRRRSSGVGLGYPCLGPIAEGTAPMRQARARSPIDSWREESSSALVLAGARSRVDWRADGAR
jgi:hypothetical protein